MSRAELATVSPDARGINEIESRQFLLKPWTRENHLPAATLVITHADDDHIFPAQGFIPFVEQARGSWAHKVLICRDSGNSRPQERFLVKAPIGTRTISANHILDNLLVGLEPSHNVKEPLAKQSKLSLAELVKPSIDALVVLDSGWDGYDGVPVRTDVAACALALLHNLSQLDIVPAAVPASDGSLQLEWFTDEVEIEVEITIECEVQVFIERAGEPEPTEFVASDTSEIQKIIPFLKDS